MSEFRRRILARRYNHACALMWVGTPAAREHYTNIVLSLASIDFADWV